MSILSFRVVELRRNSKLFLLIPIMRSNRLGSSVSLRVCLIHFQQLPDVRCARMGCEYADVGNRTGVLDPTEIIGSIIKKRIGGVFGRSSIPEGGLDYIPQGHMRPWISSTTCMLP